MPAWLVATTALVFSTLTVTAALAGPDLVSSDSNGIPLIDDSEIPRGYRAIDISADGRYVLLDNYATGFGLDANTGYPLYPENCQILRKDRVTDELLIVFESDPDEYEFCNGAKISADGNIVASSPIGPSSNSDCSVIAELENGQFGCDFGVVTALIVRNLSSGEDNEVRFQWITQSARPIGSGAFGRYPGKNIHSLNSAGDTALITSLAVIGNITQAIFELVDVTAGTVEPVILNTDEGNYVFISGIALSEDGTRIALNAQLQSPYLAGYPYPPPTRYPSTDGPTGPDFILTCGQIGRDRCDQFGELPPPGDCGSWWGCTIPAEPPANNIYIIDRISGTQTLPEALSNLPAGVMLLANAWSTDGNQLSWIETPKMPVGRCSPSSVPNCSIDACAAADCELKVHHYNFSDDLLTIRQTQYDLETLSLCRATPTTENYIGFVTELACTPRLNRNGDRLLYARAIKHPFGSDWQPQVLSGDFVCVTRESLQTPGAEPELIDCPITDPGGLPGPLPGPCDIIQICNYFPFNWAQQTSYSAPVNWYVLDLLTEHTQLVSVTDAGQLFQSNGTLFSDDGSTVIFHSRDPRLQTDDPTALAATEAAMDEACFWSPAGSSSNLRVATNDNVQYAAAAEDDFNVYRETPVFCPVPDPTLTEHVFAADIVAGVNTAVMSFRDWRHGKGAMRTWLGNFSPDRATLVTLTIEVRGLGAGGSISLDNAADCDIYPPFADSIDDTILIRCEFDALAAWEFQALRWKLETTHSASATVTTHIDANEFELRTRNNTNTYRVRLRQRNPFRRFRGRR